MHEGLVVESSGWRLHGSTRVREYLPLRPALRRMNQRPVPIVGGEYRVLLAVLVEKLCGVVGGARC